MFFHMQKIRLIALTLIAMVGLASLQAAETAPTVGEKSTPVANATASTAAQVTSPDLIEHLVDLMLERFGVNTGGNTPTHWAIFAGLMIGAWVLRTFITTAIFKVLKHFASKTETTLDDKLFPALESPTKGLIFVVGTLMAFKVLKLPESVDATIGYTYKIAFPAVIFWGIICAMDAIVEHLGEVAKEKGMGIAAFLPLIKKTVIGVFIILAALTIIQSFGYDVKTFIAGLGIGGLAFALAAQDTIANLFGSFVVAIDQPFKVGENVRIGQNEGTVEDIGMRSTKLRTPNRTLIAIPNRTVANEAIVNLSRMPQRRVDQVLGVSYDANEEKLTAFIEDVREILKNDPDVHQQTIVVNFVNYGSSSLDVQVVYFTSNPDWAKHLVTRERINLRIMRALNARGLSFAFPTQTVQLDGPVARALATGRQA
jgi:MscS family membrane protein